MPKTCVKKVNNQRILNSKLCDNISTISYLRVQSYITMWVQTLFIRLLHSSFYTTFSTRFYLASNLLNKSFTHNPQYLLMSPTKEI
jgi:hypothetical protein